MGLTVYRLPYLIVKHLKFRLSAPLALVFNHQLLSVGEVSAVLKKLLLFQYTLAAFVAPESREA